MRALSGVSEVVGFCLESGSPGRGVTLWSGSSILDCWACFWRARNRHPSAGNLKGNLFTDLSLHKQCTI